MKIYITYPWERWHKVFGHPVGVDIRIGTRRWGMHW
jgi:hypothetical protein